jgi:hypothetical protein
MDKINSKRTCDVSMREQCMKKFLLRNSFLWLQKNFGIRFSMVLYTLAVHAIKRGSVRAFKLSQIVYLRNLRNCFLFR